MVYPSVKKGEGQEIITLSHNENANHRGILYRCGAQKDVAGSGTLKLSILTPADPVRVHFNPQVECEGEFQIRFLENPDAVTGGTAVTPRNANRNAGYSSACVCKADPTVTVGSAVVLGMKVLGDGKKSGGDAAPGHEWVLLPATQYVVEITDQSGAANETIISCYWIEE